MDDCIFCKFSKGEIKPITVYEDDKCIVFLDKFPLTKGQTLVVGKKHIDNVFDLSDEDYQHVFNVAKRIVKASDTAFNTIRTWLLVQGMQVAHNHIKILPIYDGEYPDLTEGSGPEVSEDVLEEQAEKLKNNLM